MSGVNRNLLICKHPFIMTETPFYLVSIHLPYAKFWSCSEELLDNRMTPSTFLKTLLQLVLRDMEFLLIRNEVQAYLPSFSLQMHIFSPKLILVWCRIKRNGFYKRIQILLKLICRTLAWPFYWDLFFLITNGIQKDFFINRAMDYCNYKVC